MKHNTKTPSQRQLRAGELLRQIISETMQRGHFHSEALLNINSVTVSEVRCSPDLKNATAYVMSLGGANMDEILPALNDEKRTFQQDIGRNSSMKFTPKISFKADETFDEAERIETLLKSVNIPQDSSGDE